ncbi:hypothetical protein BFV94_2984 [Alteromonas macleodii]|uniref:Uncharacterized protein n=1 Tax=Alteromonas macleodii TaxID=28108 RepID=A0AB36FWQ6_ALTMA|nr:hypothetical protein BFV94_2984 [Alteromonas macleodii]OES30497.1 hypothetical protein BFV95_2984 [Alteromonas macleodii]OES40373.1 hypothetical protein BFV96_2969 [Alteromonas macleodii]
MNTKKVCSPLMYFKPKFVHQRSTDPIINQSLAEIAVFKRCAD